MEFDQLTSRQKKFIELLSHADGSETPQKQAKKIGISYKTYEKWKRDTELLQIAYQEYKKVIIPRLPKVFDALVEKAEGGDVNAIKMVFQQLESFQEPSPNSGDLSTEDIIRIIQEGQQKSS